MLGISDRETVEQIKENPYLQYFIGIESYSSEEPFEPAFLAKTMSTKPRNLTEYGF